MKEEKREGIGWARVGGGFARVGRLENDDFPVSVSLEIVGRLRSLVSKRVELG